MGEKKKRRKRRRRRLKRFLLGFGTVAAALLLFFVIFQTKKIEVTGNNRYTEGEIRNLVEQQEPFSFNTVLLTFLPFHGDFSGVPFLDNISYEILSPSTVRAVVQEKKTVGYVELNDQKAYFDENGIVLECIPIQEETQEEDQNLDVQPLTEDQGDTDTLDSQSLPTARAESKEYDPDLDDIPQVTGLDVNSATVGEQLSTDNTEIFKELGALTRLLDKYELWPEQVEISGGKDMILHYEGNIRVLLGDGGSLEEKITRLSGILPQLDGMSGELHLEDVDERDGDVVFSKDVAAEDGQNAQDTGADSGR